MMIFKTRWAAIAVFSIALAIRLYYTDTTVHLPGLRGDAISYFNYGFNLANHGVFSRHAPMQDVPVPDSYWAPGFPLLIAVIIKLLGDEKAIMAIFYTHAVLGALAAMLTVLVGLRIMPLWASVSAGLLMAFSPHSVAIGNNLLTETLFTFALLLAIMLYYRAEESRSVIRFFGAGLGFGCSYMINPTVFFLPLLLACRKLLADGWRLPRIQSPTHRNALIFLCIFLLFPFFWSVRGAISVPPASQNAGQRALENFIIGSYPEFFDLYRKNPRDPANPATLDIMRFKGNSATYIATWGERISHDPVKYSWWYFLEKPRLLWGWNILVGWGDIYVYQVVYSPYATPSIMLLSYVLMKALHPWLIGFAIAGLPVCFLSGARDFKRYLSVIYVALVYLSSVYLLLQSEPRYSIPLRPELYLSAMFFLSYLTVRYRQYKGSLQLGYAGSQAAETVKVLPPPR